MAAVLMPAWEEAVPNGAPPPGVFRDTGFDALIRASAKYIMIMIMIMVKIMIIQSESLMW